MTFLATFFIAAWAYFASPRPVSGDSRKANTVTTRKSGLPLVIASAAFVSVLMWHPNFAGAMTAAIAATTIFVTTTRTFSQVAGPSPMSVVQASTTLDHIRMCLASGLTIPKSIAVVAQMDSVHPSVQTFSKNLRGDPALAFGQFAADQPVMASASYLLERCFVTGAPLHSALGILSDHLRRDAAQDVTRRVRAVAVKAVLPLGLCFLPAFVLVTVVPIAVGMFSQLSW